MDPLDPGSASETSLLIKTEMFAKDILYVLCINILKLWRFTLISVCRETWATQGNKAARAPKDLKVERDPKAILVSRGILDKQ